MPIRKAGAAPIPLAADVVLRTSRLALTYQE